MYVQNSLEGACDTAAKVRSSHIPLLQIASKFSTCSEQRLIDKNESARVESTQWSKYTNLTPRYCTKVQRVPKVTYCPASAHDVGDTPSLTCQYSLDPPAGRPLLVPLFIVPYWSSWPSSCHYLGQQYLHSFFPCARLLQCMLDGRRKRKASYPSSSDSRRNSTNS